MGGGYNHLRVEEVAELAERLHPDDGLRERKHLRRLERLLRPSDRPREGGRRWGTPVSPEEGG